MKLQQQPQRYVYFVSDAEHQAIKVGIASDPEGRLSRLQVGNCLPLTLLGYIEGGPLREASIHRQLEGHRILGEWFKADVVMTLMDAIAPDEWVMRDGVRSSSDALDVMLDRWGDK